jgi:hypothetical protein
MNNDKNKRKAKRKDFFCETKVRFAGQDNYTAVTIRDISVLGLRVVIAGRFVKPGDILEIKMHINDRDIQCKGKVTWVLMLRPSLGNINVLDTGVEFFEITAADQEFLKKLTEN